MLECLDPSPPRVPLREGVHTKHAASSSESPPRGGDRVAEEVEESRVYSGGGGRDGGGGHAVDGEGQTRRGEQREDMPVTHTCWVKSGHDLLHERAPFLRALLHKVGTR